MERNIKQLSNQIDILTEDEKNLIFRYYELQSRKKTLILLKDSLYESKEYEDYASMFGDLFGGSKKKDMTDLESLKDPINRLSNEQILNRWIEEIDHEIGKLDSNAINNLLQKLVIAMIGESVVNSIIKEKEENKEDKDNENKN